ncbi:uroporphyrinogen III methyltransferase / synthase [Frankia sp. EI5c]|uniref:uroporphyrinogen-III C-methyltransferase n=1 Tax=Frankia sp. EI5c TaxID=683316 RepID=UPI0007C3E223|nr:uroporphyrinogen-III C-methyltransferase [Frankia sp. EI5c]OAA26452.1 uroporphyrinogen III methyltransferase / synthase [Frankia sp. EI5c]
MHAVVLATTGPGAHQPGSDPAPTATPRRGPGEVWLVGAGPGDPGLLTVRGRELLASADVVVTDRLAAAVLLDAVRPDARVIQVGKSPTRSRSQDEVNQILVEQARAGALVVRLKGGDPFLLGRGGEEAEACAAAGIPCTVVPGVTSAIAAPAYAGIPVTHRGVAQDLAIVSGHLPPDHPESTVDWGALAASRATIVVLMGVARLIDIVDALLRGGRPHHTPAAVVERGTTPAQRVLRSTLDAIAVDAVAFRLRSPAVLVVGPVAARCDAPVDRPAAGTPATPGTPTTPATSAAGAPTPVTTAPGRTSPGAPGRGATRAGATAPGAPLPGVAGRGVTGPGVAGLAGGVPDRVSSGARAPTGRGDAPLAGVRVLVPRTRARQGLLARRLRELGADAVETVVSSLVPATDGSPLRAALPGADGLVLADAEEVAATVALLRAAGTDVRALAGLTLVAASDSAAGALDRLGLVCVRSSAEVQVAGRVMTEVPVPGLRVVICGEAPPPAGIRTLRRVRLLADVTTEADPRIAEELRHGDIDAVALASSTAARCLAELYGPLPANVLVAAMGRRTVQACEAMGLRVDAVPPEPGIYPLAAVVADLVAARPAPRG